MKARNVIDEAILDEALFTPIVKAIRRPVLTNAQKQLIRASATLGLVTGSYKRYLDRKGAPPCPPRKKTHVIR